MNLGLEYREVSGVESVGHHGAVGIRIMVASSVPLDLKSDEIQDAAWTARENMHDAMKAALQKVHPDTPKETERNRELVSLFSEPIFVEELPNGYCDRWCCKHKPWFKVTTKIGHFVIGWRKRVINIDWSGTVGTGTEAQLFLGENVTQGEKYIHAWSMEDAKRYIDKIMASAGGTNDES